MPIDDCRLSEIDQPSFMYYRELLPAVGAHLERYFQVAKGFDLRGYPWIVVLERRGDRGEAEIDLFEIRDRGQSWMFDPQDRVLPHGYILPELSTSHNRRPLPISLDGLGGGVDFVIDVPDGAVFQADIGLGEVFGTPTPHPRVAQYLLAVSRGDAFEQVASARALEGRDPGTRWRPFEADLSAYAGERITLRLSIELEPPIRKIRLGWWGSPRIIVRERAPSQAPRGARGAE